MSVLQYGYSYEALVEYCVCLDMMVLVKVSCLCKLVCGITIFILNLISVNFLYSAASDKERNKRGEWAKAGLQTCVTLPGR